MCELALMAKNLQYFFSIYHYDGPTNYKTMHNRVIRAFIRIVFQQTQLL